MPEPNTREEQFYDAIATGDASGLPDPVTRKEKYLAAIAAGETSGLPTPITREEQYLEYIAEHGGGGGDITVESLSVTENGTKTAPAGKAYSPVSVSVPNSYAAADEGKVVSNGALVSQTAHAEVTQNGTIDTTLNNSVTVNVSAADYVALIARTFTGRLDGPSLGITEIGERAFDHCTGITSAFFAGVTKTGANAMYECTGLQTAVLLTAGKNTSSFFVHCSALNAADLLVAQVYGNCFNSCSSLTTLVLRNTSVTSLQNINAFGGTPFKSGGTGGTIYIPKSLYDHLGDGTSNDYKAATNWSTIEGYGTITWAKIEGSIYENAYADGTPIPTT